jgi:hypothetical protein
VEGPPAPPGGASAAAAAASAAAAVSSRESGPHHGGGCSGPTAAAAAVAAATTTASAGGPSTPLAASVDAAVGGRGGGDATEGVEGPPPPGDASAAAAAAASSHYSCPDDNPVPFLDVFPLGGLNSKMIDCSISLPDLVRTEIESVLPGILKSGRYSPNTDDNDLNSFADLALKGMVDAFEDLRSFSRLSLDQLQHLGRGECVHEEVGDLLSNLPLELTL